jgi:hypothetical protein
MFTRTRQRFEVPTEKRAIDEPTEGRLQAAMIAEFHKLEAQGWPLTCAGDMNAARRTKAEAAHAKATGLTAGEPDVRVYVYGGRIGLIELKRKRGVVSDAQAKRHKRLAELGHKVFVVKLGTETEARETAREIARALCPGWQPGYAPVAANDNKATLALTKIMKDPLVDRGCALLDGHCNCVNASKCKHVFKDKPNDTGTTA